MGLPGEIMVSAMGDAEGRPKGGFVLLDEDFKVCPGGMHARCMLAGLRMHA